MGDSSQQITAVTIYNQTFQVRSENDPQYIRQLAQHVDEKMAEITQHTSTVDSVKVAILAALNIADEYFLAKQRLETLETRIRQKTEKMIALLESHVDSGAS